MKSKLFISGLLILLVTTFPLVFAAEISRTYDANGNLLRNSDEDFYREYNSLNQLSIIRNATNDNIIQEYIYHPTEERVLVKKTYDESETLVETVVYFDKTNVRVINDSGTYDTTYVYHEGSLVAEELSGVKTYHHSDHLGSSTVVTDSSGDVIENTSYSPYGEVLTGGSSRYDYEGKETDEVTREIDFEARMSNSEYGIFNQPDNIMNTYNPQGLNPYMFEDGNPMSKIDPDGRMALMVNPTALVLGQNQIMPTPLLGQSQGRVNIPVDYVMSRNEVKPRVGDSVFRKGESYRVLREQGYKHAEEFHPRSTIRQRLEQFGSGLAKRSGKTVDIIRDDFGHSGMEFPHINHHRYTIKNGKLIEFANRGILDHISYFSYFNVMPTINLPILMDYWFGGSGTPNSESPQIQQLIGGGWSGGNPNHPNVRQTDDGDWVCDTCDDDGYQT